MPQKCLKDKLLDAMRKRGYEVPGDNSQYTLHRTHAGYWQRSAGAWSWFITYAESTDATPQEFVGSCAPLAECVKPGFTVGHSLTNSFEVNPACDSAPSVARRTKNDAK